MIGRLADALRDLIGGQERAFKQTSSVDQLAIHFSLDGNMIHKESDEARRQLARHGLGEGRASLARKGRGRRGQVRNEPVTPLATYV